MTADVLVLPTVDAAGRLQITDAELRDLVKYNGSRALSEMIRDLTAGKGKEKAPEFNSAL